MIRDQYMRESMLMYWSLIMVEVVGIGSSLPTPSWYMRESMLMYWSLIMVEVLLSSRVAESERSLQELLGLCWHLVGLGKLNSSSCFHIVHLHSLGCNICTHEALSVNILYHGLVVEASSRSVMAVHFACRAVPCLGVSKAMCSIVHHHPDPDTWQT